MDISLLHAGLAGGAALAVVPLILHLLMRQTPKHVIFPALRLIRERQKQSKKRLRVKNWLLLLARMALFMLMALALARPTLHTSLALGDGEVDSAIALVVDTSLSMEYTERGKNRLEEAKLRAAEILKKATDRSEIFVIDSAEPRRETPVSPSLALKRVEALTIRAANKRLNDAVVQAYAVVGASEMARKEVYVLTDLARSAWDTSSTALAETVRKVNTPKPKIQTYVLRLTPKDVKDVAVISAEPASAVVTQGDPVAIKAKIRSWGPKTSRLVNFQLDGQPRDKQTIELAENGDGELTFTAPNTLAPGLHQGEVVLDARTDNMRFDDVRFFSFNIQPAQRVLIISDVLADALPTQKALAPDRLDPSVPQIVKVDRITSGQFSESARNGLKKYAAIFLLNVARPSESDWGALSAYVHEGGGLLVALGERVVADAYNAKGAAQLLPASLIDGNQLRAPNTFFAKPDHAHPVFSEFAKELDATLSRVLVYRAWKIEPQLARTVLSLTDGTPAVVERQVQGPKTGHVMLWVTPFRHDADARQGWNELVQFWPIVEILLQSVAYFSGTSGEQHNYEAGNDAVLTLDPAHRASNYNVEGPDPKENGPISPAATSPKLVVPAPQALGQWRVSGLPADGVKVVMGFSVNPIEGEELVVPLEEKQLFDLFGSKDYVKLAQDANDLRGKLHDVRVGFEIFPWLMMLILVIVTLENLLANKFHRERVPAA
jgi:Aerotolerance regulator N-terminal/von Willebrand factor type A domain